ncbi:MAG: hypothetical protein QOE41_148 [Mycobacterium sp.]|jgi:hypothetical protein|nr:hypothetical protein [Mycobacterium sp.]MDT5130837.1 hypothetical protein [Mycobacterium sp.]
MPTFDDSTTSPAPPEDVWMLLYDPLRFPEWWAGITSTTYEGDGDYTMYVDGYPDFPMAQTLDTSREDGNVKISCMVSDLVFQWHLAPVDGGTEIFVHVDIPEREASRLAMQRDIIKSSLRRLADLAATS